MAILEIARMGHPLLRAMALDVDEPTASDIKALVADMCDTLADIGGAGLAAPQVLVPKRVVIFHVPADRITDSARHDWFSIGKPGHPREPRSLLDRHREPDTVSPGTRKSERRHPNENCFGVERFYAWAIEPESLHDSR